jgi:hypothetical protein
LACEHEDIAVLKNQGVKINRPDIIIKNKTDKTCLSIDAAKPSERKVIEKDTEKN